MAGLRTRRVSSLRSGSGLSGFEMVRVLQKGPRHRRGVGGMSDLTNLTLAEARDAVRSKKVSSVELTKAFVSAVEAARPLNAFVTETPDRALDMARASDVRIAKGEMGALEGLPLAIKDLFCTKGVRTTAGSNILSNFVPPYESTVSQ